MAIHFKPTRACATLRRNSGDRTPLHVFGPSLSGPAGWTRVVLMVEGLTGTMRRKARRSLVAVAVAAMLMGGCATNDTGATEVTLLAGSVTLQDLTGENRDSRVSDSPLTPLPPVKWFGSNPSVPSVQSVVKNPAFISTIARTTQTPRPAWRGRPRARALPGCPFRHTAAPGTRLRAAAP